MSFNLFLKIGFYFCIMNETQQLQDHILSRNAGKPKFKELDICRIIWIFVSRIPWEDVIFQPFFSSKGLQMRFKNSSMIVSIKNSNNWWIIMSIIMKLCFPADFLMRHKKIKDLILSMEEGDLLFRELDK